MVPIYLLACAKLNFDKWTFFKQKKILPSLFPSWINLNTSSLHTSDSNCFQSIIVGVLVEEFVVLLELILLLRQNEADKGVVVVVVVVGDDNNAKLDTGDTNETWEIEHALD